ncbi:MAG: hypothetical protein ACR2RE_04585 [Geminicoccaceae bacterium]
MPGLMIATERQAYDELEAAILTSHRAGNLVDLATSYAKGAAMYERQGDIDAACFFWTQAYILALDADLEPLASAMHASLDAFDRMGEPHQIPGV